MVGNIPGRLKSVARFGLAGDRKVVEPANRSRVGLKHIYTGNSGSKRIRQALEGAVPCHIGRFGTTELRTVQHFIDTASTSTCEFPEHVARKMKSLSGFFPTDDNSLVRFSSEFIEACSTLNILAVRWEAFESKSADCDAEGLIRMSPQATPVGIDSISVPFLFEEPWTRALEDKDVLVVHPFVDSIQRGYKMRENIFPRGKELPNFNLKTLEAVQSIGTESNTGFESWFHALEHMQQEISEVNFDIAIIGAGAYGHFLASFCSAIGKVGVHLGGATQTLFGISGQRWMDPRSPDYLNDKIDANWIFPMSSEVPCGAELVEGGCYWWSPDGS